MPNLDGTGPRGLGPMTGRGLGLGRGGQDRGLVGRPRIPRCTRFDPKAKYFKPVGVPLLDIIKIRLTPSQQCELFLPLLNKKDN